MGRVWLSQTVITGPTYVGPGDVVSNASWWGGLRAYNNAAIGVLPAIRLRRDSDNTESDFNTITGGGLDIAGITSFKGAANLFATKLYDQTGGGQHFVQATAANQPAFILSGFGTLPILRFNHANATRMSPATWVTVNQPWSVVGLAKRTTIFTAHDNIILASSGNDGLFFKNTGLVTVFAFTNGDLPGSQTEGNMHTIMGTTDNAAGGKIAVDGTVTTGAIGTDTMNTNIYIGDDLFGDPFTGDEGEWGVWPVALSNTQITNLDSNMHTFWNF
jgi:hypothetical protein